MPTTTTHFIPKETIKQIAFVEEDVLSDGLSRQVRQFNLQRAQTLGNGYHKKVIISFFTDKYELRRVETTVWSVDETHISLKDEIVLPIHAILAIDF